MAFFQDIAEFAFEIELDHGGTDAAENGLTFRGEILKTGFHLTLGVAYGFQCFVQWFPQVTGAPVLSRLQICNDAFDPVEIGNDRIRRAFQLVGKTRSSPLTTLTDRPSSPSFEQRRFEFSAI